jgi:hypothetical protein
MRSLAAAALCLTLAACATTRPDAAYQAYLEANARAQQQQAAQLAAIADASACNGDPTCVTAAKGFAALAAAMTGHRAPIEQQRVQHHPAWGVLAAVLPTAVQVAGGVYQARYSRDVSLAQYGWLSDAIGSLAGSPALQGPSITVGGDYIPGSQHHGDWTGGDRIGRDQRTGDDVRRDTIGGDRIEYGSGNRFASPGPFRDTGNGPRCEGDQCQGGDRFPLPPVEPEPEPGG